MGSHSPIASVFVFSNIKRGRRNVLYWSAAVLLAMYFLVSANFDFFRSGIVGPRKIGQPALIDILSDASRTGEYVDVEGTGVYPTGIAHVKKSGRRSGDVTPEDIAAEFMVLTVGDKFLVVRASGPGAGRVKYRGATHRFPPHALDGFFQRIEETAPGVRSKFYPMMLSEEEFGASFYFLCAVMVGVALFSLVKMKSALEQFLSPQMSPDISALLRYGPLPTIYAEIESEVRSGPSKFGDSLMGGQKWLFHRHVFGINYVRSDKLVWAYPKVTKHSTNFIPTHKSYQLVIMTSFGDTIEISMSKAEVEPAFLHLQKIAPWGIYGYSDELMEIWKKNRSDFLATVDQRRLGATG